jgi:hypothetical protein
MKFYGRKKVFILTFNAFAILILFSFCPKVKENPHRIKPLANDFVTVYESPDPENIYCGTPGLAILPNGRLVATIDLFGPGVDQLPEPKGYRKIYNSIHQGKIFTSDDHGKTWTHRYDFPFLHSRPFLAGNSLYVLGHCGDLMITRSDDDGETWSEPIKLTEGEEWTGAADNVICANGCVYLALEKRLDRGVEGWQVANIAPVLMRAEVTKDLMQNANWTFASDLVFEDVIDYGKLHYHGIPFFEPHPKQPLWPAPDRAMSSMGWLETNVVQFSDPKHIWYDPGGKTFHLFMRAHSGGTGYAALAKVIEKEDGSMTSLLETVPSGKEIVFVPFPGGQMKFFVIYDEVTKLYWMVGTQATDSMTRIDLLPEDRYNLPNNERRRLVLHFSTNMIDWCFAGLVAVGEVEKASRHYASMVIDGDDLHILSRSGDERAKNSHNGNLITFHSVKNFRGLVY